MVCYKLGLRALFPAIRHHCTVIFCIRKWVQGEKAVDRMNGKRIKDTCQGRGAVWTEWQYGVRSLVWRGN